MCPPPRSLALEANGCFMVQPPKGQPNTRLRCDLSRPTAGSPRIRISSFIARRDNLNLSFGSEAGFRRSPA